MARRLRSDAVHSGRNKDNSAYKDDRHVRCARCGFICHLDRDNRHPDGSRAGWGMKYIKQDRLTLEASALFGFLTLEGGGSLLLEDNSDGILYDPVVTGGCPQCGTFRYDR